MLTTAILSAAIFTDCADDPDLGACDCADLNDWASFALLLFELNLVVYADYAGSKSSGDAIKKLREASASTVGVKRDGQWRQLPTRQLVPGDFVAVTIGMTIPADGVAVHDGEPLKLDYASLTGEPLPEKKSKGDAILSGAVVLVGEGEMVITHTGIESSLGTTQALIAEAKKEKENGGELANILSKVVIALCIFGTAVAVFVAGFTGIEFQSSILESIKLGFVLLSTILPVTMPLILTTVLAIGAQELAKDDAVVQRFSAIPEMANMDILCSDKTGTLTLGKMNVIKEESVTFHDDITVDEMMELALVATRIEHSDPIDAAITNYFDDAAATLGQYEIKKFIPFDPSTKKVTAMAVKKMTGQEITVVKGAPPVIMNYTGVDPEVFALAEEALDEKSERGYKTLAVAVEMEDESWKLLGFISILDPPRSDTGETVQRCNELGVEVKMITGDQRLIAVEVARQLNFQNLAIFEKDVFNNNSHVVDQAGGFGILCERAGGFAGVSPEHKHRVVTALQDRGHFVGMTGDGVNDAPALSIANVGIAVADATDAARGASDIVLQQEGLGTIVKAIYGSRKIFKRIESYLTYRICSSVTFGLTFSLIFSASKYSFPTWTLILLSILNDFAVSSSSKDQVVIQRKPVRLQLDKVSTVAIVMGIISALEVWGLVHTVVMHNPGENHFWGLRPNDGITFTGCETAAYIFLALLITLQLDLIAARSPKPFFIFSTQKDDAGHFLGVPPPSIQVLITVSITLTIGTLIAILWNDSIVVGSGYGMEGIGWRNGGLVWAWGFMWFVVIDLTKFFVITLFEVSKSEGEGGMSWKAFFTNVLTLPWDEESDKRSKNQMLDTRRQELKKFNPEESIRSSLRAVSTTGPQFSVGLAAIAQEEQEDKRPLISYQDQLLAVETLQHDSHLLRVIAEMHYSIIKLQKRVDHLEGKTKYA
mmetsp:Transcript_27096/g.45163  ORF Transcript_27096/g.45163 Transcript_27096/m.45163 type:complete len:939 (+) Transcript_27096:3-2819(+)